MPAEHSGTRVDPRDVPIDPRFDPVFQRGYSGTVQASSPPADTGRSQPRGRPGAAVGAQSAPATAVEAQTDVATGERWMAEHSGEPADRHRLSAIAWPEDDDDAADAAAWWYARRAAGGRRWLTALWWIGALLLALGISSLAYGIWANYYTAGQYQDFWIEVYSSIAWQIYGPTMTIGLATLVATGVVQALAPSLREEP
jgi:hypothetical protein